MDNCDLEKLSVSGVKLHPAFKPEVTDYKVTVESSVDKVTLHLSTSDCGASHRILFGEGSSTIKLNVGLNRIEIEVVAEDGTIKKYCVEITRLSAKVAELSNLALAEDIPLYPAFCTKTYEYNGGVPFHCNAVTLLPTVPDKNIKVTVNGESSSQPVPLNFGDTMVEVSVHSADGSNVQVYTVLMTRELIPMAVTFTDKKQQLDYECPISLTALYRPVSINQSDPKHIFSRPYIEMLARRSKVDPLSDSPLGDSWKVVELDLDRKMSTALVKCFFTYRGCDSVMKLSELGSHSLDCAHKPTGELDAKDVTETSWYKKHFASSSCLEIETKHSLEVRNWEKRLQLTVGEEDDVDKLCDLAQDHMKLYRQRLPKPGEMLQTEEGQSPLHNLEQAAVHYASAISLSTRDARLHFMLGVVLHEQHHATEMYGRQKKADKDKDELSDAKSTALQDDILAVCKLHGFPGTPTVQNQLQALDKEYQTLREQGQSGKADYVQTLYIWLSKQSGKDSSAAVRDEESYIHRALMKYLDAWSLSPDSWEFNLHVGRLLLLLQGRSREALQHLQSGLALRPLHPALRFFTGLALLKQEQKASADTEKEAALFLQQGLEHFVSQRCSKSWVEQDPSDPLSSLSTQFLRGLLTLGELQQRNILSGKAMDTEQVYHTVAVLTAQSVSQCVCRGELSARLEWVLLDAQFALLQRLIQQGACQAKAGIESPVAKRCQALTALIRLTSIAPCQELLDMQERACQLAVLTTPRDSHSLCLLGLAQLAQYDKNPNSDRSKEAMTEACLSFQASIELENKSQSGEPPEQLSKQKWWQKWHEAERAAKQPVTQAAGVKGLSDGGLAKRGAANRGGRGGPGTGRGAAAVTKPPAPAPPAPVRGGKVARPPARTPAGRGRPAAAAQPDKPPINDTKPQLPANNTKQDSCPNTGETAEEPAVSDSVTVSGPVNRRSHVSRLGLARALSRSAHTQDQAQQLFHEVISMAPGVHDAYTELVQLLEPTEPQAAVEVYCRFPLKPVDQQSFCDAFITGEIVRMLMAQEQYDHPQLGPNLVAYGKVMGLGCIEKYIDILDGKFLYKLLKSVYAMIHGRPEEDEELQDFFKFKCWI